MVLLLPMEKGLRIEDCGLRIEGMYIASRWLFYKGAIAYLTQKRIVMTIGPHKNVAQRLIPSILNPQSSILFGTLLGCQSKPPSRKVGFYRLAE